MPQPFKQLERKHSSLRAYIILQIISPIRLIAKKSEKLGDNYKHASPMKKINTFFIAPQNQKWHKRGITLNLIFQMRKMRLREVT